MADTAYFNGETVLDGIPRKQFQVKILDQLVEIDLAVGFRCTDDYLVKHQQAGAWKQKLQAYAEQSRPLEDCYQKRKRLLDFQVGSAPAENWQGLLAALHLQHTNTVYSSKKLAYITGLVFNFPWSSKLQSVWQKRPFPPRQ